MPNEKGLLILHIDGLGYHYLKEALAQGRMPFIQQLLQQEGYELMRYRCGIPSTTPFVQAGILFGDNSEIPAFRWWDKEENRLVEFGGRSSFKYVAHKYFQNCHSLVTNGASIAACYPADAADTFNLDYRSPAGRTPARRHLQRHILMSWLANPIHLVDWTRHGLWQIWKANLEYWRAYFGKQRIAKTYVIADMLEEIFLHQFTRFAVTQAMHENYPSIYAAFYAYDETAHAFGPAADYSWRILSHIDNSIRRVAHRRRTQRSREYEMVILSDHGQVETTPFNQKYGLSVSELLAQWLPTYEIEEHRGKKITPPQNPEGHIVLTYSGGLAHLYFKDLPGRLDHHAISQNFPGLIEKISSTMGIDFVMVRDERTDVLFTREGPIRFSESSLDGDARRFLQRFDDAEVIARQLHKLDSFERSGDLVLFGQYGNNRQINFEHQVGGHGSIGGEQLFPFILAKREWGFDTGEVVSASDLHAPLVRLRDEVLHVDLRLPSVEQSSPFVFSES